MSSEPVRLDRLQAGLVALAQSALPNAVVLWAPSEYPRADAGTDTIVTFRLLTGPHLDPIGGESTPIRTLPTAATYTISGATIGQTARIRLSGLTWDYVVTGGDTDETVRDALLSAIGSAPMVSASFAAVGPNQISVTANAVGDLWSLSALGPVTVVTTATVVASVTLGTALATVEAQCFSNSRYLRTGATRDLSRMLASMQAPSARGIITAHGLAFGSTPTVISLDTISGPGWASRAAATLRVHLPVCYAESAELIDTAAGTIDARDADPNTTVTIGPVS